ncbi:ion transporter [Anaerofustis sp. NSJ-163]|nr:ion transporter [Anaerofustis sp. NSJ-163]MCO8192973.1 ion transporter [Anaerofustis sp. NSJ-163]
MREKIFKIVYKPTDEYYIQSKMYDLFICLVIILSMIPLCFKTNNKVFYVIDIICFIVFFIDYVLRFITADYKLEKGKLSFILYPFTFLAIIDLISMLPVLYLLNDSLKMFRLFRIFKTCTLLRSFRYSKNIKIVFNAVKKEKDILTSILFFAFGYILFSAFFMFNVEPGTFDNFFEAIYWATSALTTIGYGDIYPVTFLGRIVSIISSFFGIAIIALPSGIITAAFINEFMHQKGSDE